MSQEREAALAQDIASIRAQLAQLRAEAAPWRTAPPMNTPEILAELRAIRALLERQLVFSMCATMRREPPEFGEQLNQAWTDSQLAAPVLPDERRAAAEAATRYETATEASPRASTTSLASQSAAAAPGKAA